MAKRRKSKFRPPQSRQSDTRKLLGVLALPVGVILLLLGVHFANLFRQGSPEDADHEHEPPPHGGLVVRVGDGDQHYHLEMVRKQGGFLMLYTLGEDAKKAVAVATQMPQAQMKQLGSESGVSLEYMPFPRTGDGAGKTSRFLAKLPRELRGSPLTVSIASVVFDASRLPVEFSLPPERGSTPGDFEKKLFLTAAGKYTDEDIQANGQQTAEERFPAFKPHHDVKPRPGEKVCPITRIKATATCSWVVAGHNYEFCCPPCIEQFVKAAKECPGMIQNPEEYVQKQ